MSCYHRRGCCCKPCFRPAAPIRINRTLLLGLLFLLAGRALGANAPAVNTNVVNVNNAGLEDIEDEYEDDYDYDCCCCCKPKHGC